jgi:hypothetical protein
MWRSFEFNFGQPSVVLVRVGDKVIHSSVLSNVGLAETVHPAYVCAEGKDLGSVLKLRAAMDDVCSWWGRRDRRPCPPLPP